MKRPSHRTRWLVALACALFGACVGTLGTASAANAQGFDALCTKDGIDLFAVGAGGANWRSFDGGANWVARPPLGNKALHGVASRAMVAIAVGDSGHVWRSVNDGGAWTLTTIPGAPDLTGIEFPDDNTAYVVGAGGAIWASSDGGVNWSAEVSGTAQRLNAVRFRDALTGWAVGRGGVALKTANGGLTWTPVNTPGTNELFSVDFIGNDVWAVGAFGAAWKSANAGVLWTPVNLNMDSHGDVRRVWMTSASIVTLTGGGGFLRTTNDGGATWAFATHPLLAATSTYLAYGANQAWMACSGSTAIARTNDGGLTWALPTNATTSYTWVQKQIAPFAIIRGNTFATTPQNRNSVWCVLGPYVYKSVDRGESWVALDTIPVISKTNTFYVSPKDSTHWIAAVGPPDGIAVSLDAGATWNTTLARDFGEYGSPLEMDPDKPDTLYFGPEDGRLYRTQNFGATWDTLSNPGFRSPCDITITPGNESNVLVADGVTGQGLGQVFQSTDGGRTFNLRFTGLSSENPTLWVSRLANATHYVTNWSSGGVNRSQDSGQSWSTISAVSSAWGGAVSLDDPMATAFSRYAGTPNYLSLDQGASFTAMNLSNVGSGYSLLGLDRSTWLDIHSAGVYKLVATHLVLTVTGKKITVTSPNGGEAWTAGSSHAITWTAPNVGLVHLDYRVSPVAPWQPIADVAGYAGTYAWTVPNTPTYAAQVRVSDAWSPALLDTSDAPFTIVGPAITVAPLAIAYGAHPLNSATLDSIRVTNTGTGALHVSAIAANDPAYAPGRASLTLAPGASDTVGVTFRPTAVQSYPATLTLTHDAGAASTVALSGSGTSGVQVVVVAPGTPSVWQYNHTYNVLWQSVGVSNVALDYRTSEAGAWIPIAPSVPAANGQYAWLVPNAASAQARVRVHDTGGLPEGISALFSLVVPAFAATPSPLDFGGVPLNLAVWDTVHVANAGTAPVTVSAVTSDNPRFVPGRTSFVVPAGASDTLAVTFQTSVSGPDSALFTFTADDPATPHTLRVRAAGASATGVGATPAAFAFEAAFPNPFTHATTLRFALPVACDVQLDVFTTDGRRVQSLARGFRGAGAYTVDFAPRASLPAGVYFVRLKAGAFERTRKLLHLSP